MMRLSGHSIDAVAFAIHWQWQPVVQIHAGIIADITTQSMPPKERMVLIIGTEHVYIPRLEIDPFNWTYFRSAMLAGDSNVVNAEAKCLACPETEYHSGRGCPL